MEFTRRRGDAEEMRRRRSRDLSRKRNLWWRRDEGALEIDTLSVSSRLRVK